MRYLISSISRKSLIGAVFLLFSISYFCLADEGAASEPNGVSEPVGHTAANNEISKGSTSSNIEAVARVIALDDQMVDEKIKQRLEKILVASNKYPELEITVKDGLVELTGRTTEKKYVEWASEIAKNVEGVVALINDIDVEQTSRFTANYIKGEFNSIWLNVLDLVPRIILGFLVLAVFSFIASPLSLWLMNPLNRKSKSHLIHIVIQRSISIFFILIGVYFFLRIAGLTQFALAIISGTGVIGLVLGFAFRDIAENFIASLLISAQRPFHLGDVIEVQGHLGVVQKVTARGTTLVDYDGNHIQIPNAIVYKNIIQNLSANPRLRGKFVIGIGYDASIKLAQDLGIKLMLEHHAVLNDPEPQILVDSLGPSTIILKVYFWVNSETHSVLKVSSILMRLIMREFERNGISMPDDAREIIFPQGIPLVRVSGEENAPAELSNQKPTSGESSTTILPIAFTETQKSVKTNVIAKDTDHDVASDDLSSDTDNIREQAKHARAPEQGSNII